MRNNVRNIYKEKNYWYHISTTLKKKEEYLVPWDNFSGFNRPTNEPNIKRICVSPTLEQCLTSVPYGCCDKYVIYRTKNKVIATEPFDVFDSKITNEGWLTRPIKFVSVGRLSMYDIEEKLIEEAASEGNEEFSKEVYRWWKKLDPWKYVKNI